MPVPRRHLLAAHKMPGVINPLACCQLSGRRGLVGLRILGDWLFFTSRTVLALFSPPWKLKPVIKELQAIGASSVVLIAFTGLFTGMVLGLQGHHTLRRFGAEGALGTGVSLSLLSELGPVLSALLLTGRAGSALCAQIGVMRISEQIDALECMGIDVYNYLISPKLVAALIAFPLLAFMFCLTGVWGGYIAGVSFLGVSAGAYMDGLVQSVDWPLLRMCLVKSVFFGFLMVTICAQRGFRADQEPEKGALGVSRATTGAVVITSVQVLLWDYLLTNFLIQA